MARILVVYGTRQGHTAHIADRIANTIRAMGHEVDAYNLRLYSPPPSTAGYHAVMVGASVHARGFEKEVRRWVAGHADELAAVPNAFFTVSLSAAEHDEKNEAELQSVIDYFVEETEWRPARIARFAGEIAYSQYNWLLRRVMRRIVKKEAHGHYTDTSHDYDLTDYEAVDAFAREFASSLAVV